jgi:hypothetical protein
MAQLENVVFSLMSSGLEGCVELRYPWQRGSIIDALKAFSDPDFQRRMWVDRLGEDSELIENMDINAEILYDDTNAARDPYGSIGVNLKNEDEARAIEEFDKVFGPFYASLTPETDDATAIGMPEWANVVAAARAALSVFSSGD